MDCLVYYKYNKVAEKYFVLIKYTNEIVHTFGIVQKYFSITVFVVIEAKITITLHLATKYNFFFFL